MLKLSFSKELAMLQPKENVLMWTEQGSLTTLTLMALWLLEQRTSTLQKMYIFLFH